MKTLTITLNDQDLRNLKSALASLQNIPWAGIEQMARLKSCIDNAQEAKQENIHEQANKTS